MAPHRIHRLVDRLSLKLTVTKLNNAERVAFSFQKKKQQKKTPHITELQKKLVQGGKKSKIKCIQIPLRSVVGRSFAFMTLIWRKPTSLTHLCEFLKLWKGSKQEKETSCSFSDFDDMIFSQLLSCVKLDENQYIILIISGAGPNIFPVFPLFLQQWQ